MKKLFPMRLLVCIAISFASLIGYSQPNDGFLSFTGDSSRVNVNLVKVLGSTDQTIEYFFETCETQSSLNKIGLLQFVQAGITVSLTVNSAGNAANIYVEKSGNSSFSDVYSAPIYRHNTWNHFAICYHSADSTMCLYLNGDSLGTSDSLKLSETSFLLGGKGNNFFKGNLDELRISDSCLYGASYSVPVLLSTSGTTENLFSFSDELPGSKFISIGNSIDTATILAGISHIRETSITNDTAICKGDSLFLNAKGGTRFKWTTQNTISSDTISNPYIIGLLSDTLRVKISNKNGCFQTLELELLVEERPTINLGSDTVICAGDVVQLNGGSFSSFLWSNGKTDSSIISQSGKTWVEVSTPKGCTNSDTILIDEYPPIIFDLGKDTLLQTGFTVELKAPENYAEYKWSTGEKTSSILATLPLTYSVTVTDSNGCIGTDQITVNYPPKSIEESQKSHFIVYPIPSSGTLNFKFNIEPHTTAQLNMRDINGSALKSWQIDEIEGSLILPNTAPNGIYILEIITEKETSVLPIILQR